MGQFDQNRRTKIVATIGPATESAERIKELVQAGATTFRLNFSHGDHSEHAARIATIRQVSDELGINIGILQDLQGPKIRLESDWEAKHSTPPTFKRNSMIRNRAPLKIGS